MYSILPQIPWPIFFCAEPLSTVEFLEREVSNHVRRWPRLPKSLSSVSLYEHIDKLQLPFKSLEEDFTVTRAMEVMQYRD